MCSSPCPDFCFGQWNDSTILAAKDDLMKEFASPERSVYGPKQIAVIEEAVKESGGQAMSLPSDGSCTLLI